MTRQELAKAIKSVLTENTKNKLDESKIRQAIKEVLAEEPTKMPAVSFLKQYHPEVFSTIADAKIGVTNYDIADIIDDYVRYLETLREDGNTVNEETHDTIKDIVRNHGNRPSEAEVRANLTGIDDDEVLNYFGYDSGRVIGYQYGRPVYADQKKKTTNWKYSGGGYGRKRYE